MNATCFRTPDWVSGAKFALFILPATALTAILFTALVVYISSSQQVLQNQQVARDIGKRDARLLAPALWNMDFDGQKRILDVIATEERLRCIRVEEVIYEDNVMPREIATAGECQNLDDTDIEKSKRRLFIASANRSTW